MLAPEPTLSDEELVCLGLFGAGRLGSVIARVWMAQANRKMTVWSRRGRYEPKSGCLRLKDVNWVSEWHDLLSAERIVAAIPGRALVELARHSHEAQTFEGSLYSAAVAVPQTVLQGLFPRATVVRVAMFLVDGVNSIPMLALRPSRITDETWETVLADLRCLGEVDVVEDEPTFDHLTLLGSPWPTVLESLLHSAVDVGVAGLTDESVAALGRRMIYRALSSSMSRSCPDSAETAHAADQVATPGGITEHGLRNIQELAHSLDAVLVGMFKHATQLRVTQEDGAI